MTAKKKAKTTARKPSRKKLRSWVRWINPREFSDPSAWFAECAWVFKKKPTYAKTSTYEDFVRVRITELPKGAKR